MEAAPGFSLAVQGLDCPGVFPVDGIAYNVHTNRVYYCPLSSKNLYSIVVDDFFTDTNALRKTVRLEGPKPDATDGMAMSADGTLFFGGLQGSAVYSWPVFEIPP